MLSWSVNCIARSHTTSKAILSVVGERGGGGQPADWLGCVSMEQDQHAGSQESATGPAGKRQTDEARPKLSRARALDK